MREDKRGEGNLVSVCSPVRGGSSKQASIASFLFYILYIHFLFLLPLTPSPQPHIQKLPDISILNDPWHGGPQSRAVLLRSLGLKHDDGPLDFVVRGALLLFLILLSSGIRLLKVLDQFYRRVTPLLAL